MLSICRIQLLTSLLFLLLIEYRFYVRSEETSTSYLRNPTESIAEQLRFGVKRTTYYLDTLLESCDNVGDLNSWILFMDSYLSCKAKAERTSESTNALLRNNEDPIESLDQLCNAWKRKRVCSRRLAVKLDSCLGSRQEDGSAGTNALSLAEAHMKFICHHKVEYTRNLESHDQMEMSLPVDVRPLNCFYESKEVVQQCIREKGLKRSQELFCQKFHLAKECIVESYQMCRHHMTANFMRTLLGQLEFDLRCPFEL